MTRKPAKPDPALTLMPGQSITFVLPVVPRTKKNSPRQVKRRAKTTGKLITIPIPSEAYETMEEGVVKWARSRTLLSGALFLTERGAACFGACELLLAQPLNCAALFFRQKRIGDANGYYQGLADALEAAGVLADDKWIVQWDGSRLAKDAKRPRIEVTLTALDGE